MAEEGPARRPPVAVLVVGLAGSGKSTLINALNRFTYDHGRPAYYVNLDPATAEVLFSANVDIRDNVNYKDVMSTFGLGPNGAILTSLNLFATRFHEVIDILERTDDGRLAIFDTPGQIEAFAWSASGGMITELLSSSFPTVCVFVVDVPRCSRTATFVSTMLYGCSVMYRSDIPMVFALTKTDVEPAGRIVSWMGDLGKFEEAVDREDAAEGSSYFSEFNRATGRIFSELYESVPFVPVSGVTGEGIERLVGEILRVARRRVRGDGRPVGPGG